METIKALFRKYKYLLLLLGSGLTFIVLLMQNISYITKSVKEVSHKKEDDLIIVQNYISNDSLFFSINNVGDKVISLREAIFEIDSTYRIRYFYYPSASAQINSHTYKGINLHGYWRNYSKKIRLIQSLKPNESDMFSFKITGGYIYPDINKIEKVYLDQWRMENGVTDVSGYNFRGNYFIVFRVKFLLDNTNITLESNPIIHYFEEFPEFHGKPTLKDSIYLKQYYENRRIAKKLNSLENSYKSPQAIYGIQKIFSK